MDDCLSDVRQLQESDEVWSLRKEFIERYKGDFPQSTLLSLAKVYSDVESQEIRCRVPLIPIKNVPPQNVQLCKNLQGACEKSANGSSDLRSNSVSFSQKRSSSDALQSNPQVKDKVSHRIPKKSRLSNCKVSSNGPDKNCSDVLRRNRSNFAVHRKSTFLKKILQKTGSCGERLLNASERAMDNAKHIFSQNLSGENIFEINTWPKRLKNSFIDILQFIKKSLFKELSTSEILHTLSKKFNLNLEYFTKILPPVGKLPVSYECSVGIDAVLMCKAEGSTKKRARVAAAKLLVDKFMWMSREVGNLSLNYFSKSLKHFKHKILTSAEEKYISEVANINLSDSTGHSSKSRCNATSSVASENSTCDNSNRGQNYSYRKNTDRHNTNELDTSKNNTKLGNRFSTASSDCRNSSQLSNHDNHISQISDNYSCQKNLNIGDERMKNLIDNALQVKPTTETTDQSLAYDCKSSKFGKVFKFNNGFYVALGFDKNTNQLLDINNDDHLLCENNSCEKNPAILHKANQNSVRSITEEKFTSEVTDVKLNAACKLDAAENDTNSSHKCSSPSDVDYNTRLLLNCNDSLSCENDSNPKNTGSGKTNETLQNSLGNFKEKELSIGIGDLRPNDLHKLYVSNNDIRLNEGNVISDDKNSILLNLDSQNSALCKNDSYQKNVDSHPQNRQNSLVQDKITVDPCKLGTFNNTKSQCNISSGIDQKKSDSHSGRGHSFSRSIAQEKFCSTGADTRPNAACKQDNFTKNTRFNHLDVPSGVGRKPNPMLKQSYCNSLTSENVSYQKNNGEGNKGKQNILGSINQCPVGRKSCVDVNILEIHRNSTCTGSDIASVMNANRSSKMWFNRNGLKSVINGSGSLKKKISSSEGRKESSLGSVTQEKFTSKSADLKTNNSFILDTSTNKGRCHASLGIGRNTDPLSTLNSNSSLLNFSQEGTDIHCERGQGSIGRATQKTGVVYSRSWHKKLLDFNLLKNHLNINILLVLKLIEISIIQQLNPTSILHDISEKFHLKVEYNSKIFYGTESFPVHECSLRLETLHISKAQGSSKDEACANAARLAICALMDLAAIYVILNINFNYYIVPFCNVKVSADKKLAADNSAAEHSASRLNNQLLANFGKILHYEKYPAFFAILDYSDISKLSCSSSVFINSADLNKVKFDYSYEMVTTSTESLKVSANIMINGEIFASASGHDKHVAKEAVSKTALNILRKTAFTVKMNLKNFDGFTVYRNSPVRSNFVFNAAKTLIYGSGKRDASSDPYFKREVRNVFEAYAKLNPCNDLIFCGFRRKEKNVIHNMALSYHFNSYYIGGNISGRDNVIISRYHTSYELVDHLIQYGGNTLKYELIPPYK